MGVSFEGSESMVGCRTFKIFQVRGSGLRVLVAGTKSNIKWLAMQPVLAPKSQVPASWVRGSESFSVWVLDPYPQEDS